MPETIQLLDLYSVTLGDIVCAVIGGYKVVW